MNILVIAMLIGFLFFVIDLLSSGPQSKSEREYNLREGRVNK